MKTNYKLLFMLGFILALSLSVFTFENSEAAYGDPYGLCPDGTARCAYNSATGETYHKGNPQNAQ